MAEAATVPAEPHVALAKPEKGAAGWRNEQYRRARAARERREAEEFKVKARECLGIDGLDVLERHLGATAATKAVDRIVEAMRWAQSK